jgi:hypothetical protein
MVPALRWHEQAPVKAQSMGFQPMDDRCSHYRDLPGSRGTDSPAACLISHRPTARGLPPDLTSRRDR